jgi:hypothetical protein
MQVRSDADSASVLAMIRRHCGMENRTYSQQHGRAGLLPHKLAKGLGCIPCLSSLGNC